MKPLSERIPTAVRSPPDCQDLPHGRALAVLRGIARPTICSELPVRLGRRDGPPGRSRPPDLRDPFDPLRVPQLPHGDDRPSDQLVLLGDRVLPVVLRRGHAVRHRGRPRGYRRGGGAPPGGLSPPPPRARGRAAGPPRPRAGRAGRRGPRRLAALPPPPTRGPPRFHGPAPHPAT